VKDLSAKFQPLQIKLLSFASYLAQLPSEQLGRDNNLSSKLCYAGSDHVTDLLTNPAAHHNVGWSHGKEALKSGKYDIMKDSYYAAVISAFLQSVVQSTSLDSQATFEWPNIWPAEDLVPGFRKMFGELCTMIIDVALLVARACDQFAAEFVKRYISGTLERILRESMTVRARLLHYFPPSTSSPSSVSSSSEYDNSWCALHVDDGCLTGFTSALFVDESAPLPSLSSSTFKPVPPFGQSPDPLSGLYIRSRKSDVANINIPADCVAFQTGSALELMTGGALKAVPHFVRGPNAGNAVSRNTLAVFTQPNLKEIVDLKTGVTFGGIYQVVGREACVRKGC
jgi:isopenicillin N synthase-like dioxygenase